MTQPTIDPELLARLVALAEQIDGSDPGEAADRLAEFNRLAGAEATHADLQEVWRSEEYADRVTRIVTDANTPADPSISREQLTEMFARVLADPTDNGCVQYVITTVKKTFNDQQVSDLIFWPGEYFGDGQMHHDLTPEQMADAVLQRAAEETE